MVIYTLLTYFDCIVDPLLAVFQRLLELNQFLNF